MEILNEEILKLKKAMYSIYGVANGTILRKEHNMIKWSENELGTELFNKIYDEYFEWLKYNTTPEKIRVEKEIEQLKSMLESCFTYGGLDKENRYIKPYIYTLGIELFNKVFDEYSKYLRENYIIKHNVYTDNEGVTYNSLIKLI
jgi:hypothetical protein